MNEATANKLKAIETRLGSHLGAKNELESQETENVLVLEELKVLEADAVVYRLVGPGLIREPHASALETVTKRLQFIRADIQRVNSLIAGCNDEFQATVATLEQDKPKPKATASA